MKRERSNGNIYKENYKKLINLDKNQKNINNNNNNQKVCNIKLKVINTSHGKRDN